MVGGVAAAYELNRYKLLLGNDRDDLFISLFERQLPKLKLTMNSLLFILKQYK